MKSPRCIADVGKARQVVEFEMQDSGDRSSSIHERSRLFIRKSHACFLPVLVQLDTLYQDLIRRQALLPVASPSHFAVLETKVPLSQSPALRTDLGGPRGAAHTHTSAPQKRVYTPRTDSTAVGSGYQGDNARRDSVGRSGSGDSSVSVQDCGENGAAPEEKPPQLFKHVDSVGGVRCNILEGLELHENAVTKAEEFALIRLVEDRLQRAGPGELVPPSSPGRPHTLQYGAAGYDYAAHRVLRGGCGPAAMPPELTKLAEALVFQGIVGTREAPDSAVVCVYKEGDSLLPHIDRFLLPLYYHPLYFCYVHSSVFPRIACCLPAEPWFLQPRL